MVNSSKVNDPRISGTMTSDIIRPTRDIVRASDYRQALAIVAPTLYRLARSPVEQSLTLHRDVEVGYDLYPCLTSDKTDSTPFGNLSPTYDSKSNRMFSYPIAIGHNHPNRNFPTHSPKDLEALIAITESLQVYFPGARPLSIVVIHDDGYTVAQIAQAKKKDRNFPEMDLVARNFSIARGITEEQFYASDFYKFLKKAEYNFEAEIFGINPDYEFFHDDMSLEEALKKFEFGTEQ